MRQNDNVDDNDNPKAKERKPPSLEESFCVRALVEFGYFRSPCTIFSLLRSLNLH